MTKAIVHVKPGVTAGLNKGGEDLHLAFTCEVDGKAIPTEFEFVLDVDDDTDGYNVERLDEEAEDDWARNGTPYTGRVKYTTWHYEFKWEGTDEDARQFLEAKTKLPLANPRSWRFCHSPGEEPRMCTERCFYVDGNAD
jgi:hypothetical protein